jgi:hypothetical protein
MAQTTPFLEVICLREGLAILLWGDSALDEVAPASYTATRVNVGSRNSHHCRVWSARSDAEEPCASMSYMHAAKNMLSSEIGQVRIRAFVSTRALETARGTAPKLNGERTSRLQTRHGRLVDPQNCPVC